MNHRACAVRSAMTARLIATTMLALAAEPNTAATLSATPKNYRAFLSVLKPGDTLRLSSGVFTQGLPLHGMSGVPGKPIVVTGDDSGAGTVLLARPGANTVSIKNAAYLVVRSLVLDGAGLPVDAVKAEGTSKFAHHITLENLTIVNHGVDQQIVGISTKCPAWNWIIRGNVIRGAGTGMYLGNSDGQAPFIGGIIENNLVVDTVGYNIEIKHQISRPAVMPLESMQTAIRNNVFSKGNGGSSGSMARPNVLLGHFPLGGVGAEDEYRVYGNFFYDNPNESLLQAEGNVSIEDNIFVNSHGDAVRIQPHHAVPRRVSVMHNTIVARGIGVAVSGGDAQFRQAVVANAVFAGMPLRGGQQRWNFTGPYEAAADFLVAPFARMGELDFSPREGRVDLPSTTDYDGLPTDRKDFYGRERLTRSAGAIAPGSNAPWRLGLERPTKEAGRPPD